MNQLSKPSKSNYRFWILSLLFIATTINYMDRGVLGFLAPKLQDMFSISEQQYSFIVVAFMISYAAGQFVMGSVIDKIGTKKGYTLSIAIWSISGMFHAAIQPAFALVGLMAARFSLGFGEAGNFPACIKTVNEWFPKKDRAFATGIFNIGASFGAVLTPLILSNIVQPDGKYWQVGFLMTGILSAIWVVLWWTSYRKPEEHAKVSAEELTYITSDNASESDVNVVVEKLPWYLVITRKETWAFGSAKITDAVWWFYMFWGAKYLASTFGLDIKNLGLPIVIIYLVASFGSILGGWLSRYFMTNKGWSVNKARKTALFIFAVAILPVSFVTMIDKDLVVSVVGIEITGQWLAVALISVAAAAHQAWSANIFSLVGDVFPKRATASATGMGAMIGSVATLFAFLTLGKTLDKSGPETYFVAFVVAGLLYVTVLGIVQLIMPKMHPLDDNLKPAATNRNVLPTN